MITRAASPRPTTANEHERTVEMVIASESDVGDGVVLSLATLPDFGPGPVPVLLDHVNSTSAMAGRLESLRIERRQLVGLARFSDAPAADEGWALARSGVAVSVGASVDPTHLEPQPRGPDVARRWRLREVTLTPVGADPLAVTRSFSLNPTMNDQTISSPDHLQLEPEDRPAHRYELAVRRAASVAGLSEHKVDELLSHDYPSKTEALVHVVRAAREEQERCGVHAGHPVHTPFGFASPREEDAASPLQTAITRCLSGEGNPQPLAEILRAHGFQGRTGADVLQAAFTGQRPENWLRRSFSTSDAKELLLSTGDRRLQERLPEADRGILQVTKDRNLADFREASILDAGLVGKALKIGEGGEITYTSINESATKYKPCRYGMGLTFTFEAMANDDLGGLAAAIDEARATIPEVEATELVALLSAGAGGNGALAPDGLQLFATGHANSTTGAMDVSGLADAVKLMRKQKTVGGRTLNLGPGYVICGPELETEAEQLLSQTWAATVPEETNPWKGLRLLIEPGIADATYYVVSSGPRMPLEIGRVAGLPRMQQTEDFDTSGMRMKIEGGFGVAVADHRVIVRVKAA